MASQLGPKWLNRVSQIAAPTHAGRLGRYAILADQINALEPTLEAETDEQLKARSTALKLRARQGDSLNGMLVEAFALVREAAKRTIKQRHYDVQLVGGAAIHYRCLAEMETGEGKTLVATLPAYLNALAGKGVHVVTVNLPDDDIEWVEKRPRFRARGMARSLVQIWKVNSPASIRPGLPWKRANVLGDADIQVLGAARLAEFLQRQPASTPGGKPAPDFVAIRPEEEFVRYFVYDGDGNCVFWNQPPGAEPIGEPSAEAKWKTLVDHVDSKGPLQAKAPDYLQPTPVGVEFCKGRSSPEESRGKP